MKGFTRNTQEGLEEMRKYEGEDKPSSPPGQPAKGQVNLNPRATVPHPLQDGKKLTPEEAAALAKALRNRR